MIMMRTEVALRGAIKMHFLSWLMRMSSPLMACRRHKYPSFDGISRARTYLDHFILVPRVLRE